MKVIRIFGKKVLSILLIFSLLFSLMPIQSFAKTAYDPKEDFKQLPLRFWEDQQPGIGFYMNASSRYILETVTSPKMGSTFGEWSVMDLLRGMYTGYDYMNDIPEDYFDKYLQGIEGYVIGKEGNLDRNKSTEWARLMLTLSSLGYDITKVGTPGTYFKTYSTANTSIVDAKKVEEGNLIRIDEAVKIYDSNRKYIEIPAGTYTGDIEANTITDSNGTVYTLTTNQFLTIEQGYNFIEKLSQSYKFSYRQGINGPIWETIAMNTGEYRFIEDSNNSDINTFGKMIGYILDKEITQSDGTVGGWALSGKTPDPDITGMALQALAPYYLDPSKYDAAQVQLVDNKGEKVQDYSYKEFAEAVERGIYILSLIQNENGGFTSFGTTNAESIVQVIVALTALNIDPLQESIDLPHINQSINFLTEGQEHEGVFTNNMIDALLTFWANGSGSSPEVGGFKHVTAGYDGGGGSGTGVNAMATDQALYGLIAYDRFKKGENKLYDMTDMINGQYKNMKAKTYEVRFVKNSDSIIKTEVYSPYAVIEIPEGDFENLRTFVGWNTAEDGSGVAYNPKELLSMPEQNITLYAQYEADIDKIIEAITALPEVADVKLSDQSAIAEVRQVYDELTSEQQKAITNQSKLVNLQATIEELQQAENDADAAKQVIEAIHNLPKETTITLESKQVVEEIRVAFNGLTETQQALVTNYEELKEIEKKLAELQANKEDKEKAEKVTDEISELTKLAELTLEHKERVEDARKSYDDLTQVQRALVTNYEELEKIEKKLTELQADKEDKEKAEKVTDEISKLTKLAELTLEHKERVEDARKSYDDLTQVQQALVTNYEELEKIEKKLAELQADKEDKEKAEKVTDEISELTKLAELTLEHKERVEDARKSYEDLTQVQQALVTNYEELEKIEKKLTDLLATEADKIAAERVTKEVNNLPEVKDVTISNRKAIEDALKSFKNLTTVQQNLVTNRDKLLSLEEKLQELIKNEDDQTVAEKVIDVIAALPEVTYLTLDHKSAVEKARLAFNSLTSAQQKFVTNQDKLVSLETKLVAEDVVSQIDSLPSVSQVTTKNKNDIEKARQAYENLTSNQRKMVLNYNDLVTLEIRLAELTDEEAVAKVIDEINNLPIESKLTLKDEKTVEKARQAYRELTANQRKMVTNYDDLVTLETKLVELADEEAVAEVMKEISNLPTESNLSVEDQEMIEQARKSYANLTAAQQELVTNYEDLTELEEKIEKTSAAAVNDRNDNSSGDGQSSDGDYQVSSDSKSPSTSGNANSSNLNNPETQSNQSRQDSQSQSGSLLPNTATNNFNLLLVGFAFIVMGVAFYCYSRKKSVNK